MKKNSYTLMLLIAGGLLLTSCTVFMLDIIKLSDSDDLFQLKGSEDLIGTEEVMDRKSIENIQPLRRDYYQRETKEQYERSIEDDRKKIMILNSPTVPLFP
ncbi:MAG: hypothetical protein PF637_05060 [Spirochaetes bacterium]|jgi:hypothetical protein|nr:hypothetical protein [Spirochaetota bacterium]